jgi:hypothetical protein
MKSEQIKHSLAVGPKSIQSRVYNAETNEVISFVKMPVEEAGLIRREWAGLTDAELAEFSEAKLGAYDLCLEVEAKLKEKNT